MHNKSIPLIEHIKICFDKKQIKHYTHYSGYAIMCIRYIVKEGDF